VVKEINCEARDWLSYASFKVGIAPTRGATAASPPAPPGTRHIAKEYAHVSRTTGAAGPGFRRRAQRRRYAGDVTQQEEAP
jgi:hypothetical protein